MAARGGRRGRAESAPGAVAAPGTAAAVGVSIAALASGTFATVAIGALAPELRADLGLSRTQIGVLTALVFAGAAAASPFAGTLTDRLGPARVLGGSLAAFAAAIAVAAASPSVPVLMAAMLLGGLAYGGVNPPTNVVIAGQMRDRIGFLMSLKQTGVPVGAFLSGLALPPIAIAAGWRAALAVAAAGALAVALTTGMLRGVAVLRSSGRAGAEEGPSRRERLGIAAYGFVMAGAQWVFLAYLVLFLTESRGWSLHRAGLALSVATAASVAARLFWGWLSDRPGRRLPVLLVTATLAAALLAVLAAGVPDAAVWPLVAGIGACLVGWNGVFHALVSDRARAGALGRLSGQLMLFVFAGSVVMPPLAGLVSERLDSWTVMWALSAGAVALAGAVLRLGLRPLAGAGSRA